MRKQIRSLEAGRALAALAVVFHHSVASVDVFAKDLPAIVRTMGGFGYLGVDFFFVLSGFILFHIHGEDGPKQIPRFVSARLQRVFLPYLPIGIGMAVLYTLLPNLSGGTRIWSWAASLTLAPASGNPALIVAWTLIYELVFYAVFAIGIAVSRPMVVVGVWTVAAFFSYYLIGEPGPRLDPFLNAIVIEFLFGMVAARCIRREADIKFPAILAVGSILAFAVFGATPALRTVFGLGMAFGVVAAVRAEYSGLIKVPAVLTFLGAASYAIYLVHNPVGALTARFFHSWLLALPATVFAGLACGIAYHLWFERPVLRRVKALARAPRVG